MGKKRYYQQDRVGSSKYTISYHDGKKKHKDGSDFFDIQTFKNKKDLAKFVNILHKGGYVYGFNESAKRDYKDEYKKFQSSTKSKKYRAELNKYNRDKGTYGNGDGKDASHKGGKIVGFESASKNRGRAEKSRLKKESVNEAISRSYYLQKYGANDEFSGKKVAKYSKFDKNKIKSDFNRFAKTLKDEEELHFMGVNTDKKRSGDDYLFSVVNQDGKNRIEITKGSRTFYKPFKSFKLESVNEDKSEIKVLVKKVGKSEIKFYDVLDTMEKKYGKRKYRIWLEKSLKDFGINPKHYDYRTNAAAEEKLFQLGK